VNTSRQKTPDRWKGEGSTFVLANVSHFVGGLGLGNCNRKMAMINNLQNPIWN